MKKIVAVIVAVFVLAGVLFYRTCLRVSEFVILSTNDMHASLENVARLATAVKGLFFFSWPFTSYSPVDDA